MSTLNVDALVGNTSANAITVRGEGTATTSLQQGLAKAFLTYNNAGSIQDSFNIGSVTDSGTGNYVTVFTNNLANALYVTAGTTIGGNGNQSVLDSHQSAGVKGTTGYEVGVSDNNNADQDNTKCQTADFGDLA
jgi:hypothetical protein